jgi:hypothetical protein
VADYPIPKQKFYNQRWKAPKGKLSVRLSARPNPDMRGWAAEVNIPEYAVTVSSLKEAQRAVNKFVSDNDLGGGNFPLKVPVTNDEGLLIAEISYNGRVWEPGTRGGGPEIKLAELVARVVDRYLSR